MKSVREQIDTIFYEPSDLFEMAGLSRQMTGLPFEVWASPRPSNRHVPRIKVWVTSNKLMPVSLHDPIEYLVPVGPKLSSPKFKLLCSFIRANRAVLLGYWRKELDTRQMVNSLRAV